MRVASPTSFHCMLQAYPPVPNWYTSHCSCTADTLNYYVYASRNAIVVLDLATFGFVKMFLGAIQRINAISTFQQFCYTASNDTIRAWNLIDSRLLVTYKAIHKSEITVIRCIRNGTTLVSGDKSGVLVLQLVSADHSNQSQKVNSEIRTIAPVCYGGQEYIAIAYANGMIYIEKILDDLTTETVHQVVHPEVNNLAWQYQAENQEAWPLLASSTRRSREVFIWNIPEESKHAVVRLPAPSAKWTDQQRNTLWIDLAWSPLEKEKLWTTTYMGGIICFKVSNNGTASFQGRLPDVHSRIAFSLVWVNQGRMAVSYALDKQLIYWDVHKRIARVRMLTQAAFPYSIDISAWNPGLAAVGMGDSNIKIWQFSSTMDSEANNFYQADAIWKDLQGQIRHVRWHPTQESRLAYSNEYGRIGLYDTAKGKHSRFKGYHEGKGAPTIAWGGDLFLGEQGIIHDSLISCGADGKILVFRIGQPHIMPVNLEDVLTQANPAWSKANQAKVRTRRCSVAVDAAYRFLAIGNTDGVVEVYRLDTLKVIYTCNVLTVDVTAMAWDGTDQNYLAVGYRSGNITIHKINVRDNPPEVPVPDSISLCKSEFHKKQVNCLAWSHHTGKAYLASGSADESVGVHKVDGEGDRVHVESVGHFKQHRGHVLSVCWGYEDSDMLFSGAEDRFIFVWKWTDYLRPKGKHDRTSAKEKEMAALHGGIAGKKTESATAAGPSPTSPDTRQNNEAAQHAKKKRKIPTALMIASRRSQHMTTQDVMLRRSLLLAANIYGGDPLLAVEQVKSRIPLHIHPSLYESHTGSPYDGDSEMLDLFFGDKNDMRRLLQIEGDQMAQVKERSWPAAGSENFDLKLALDLMRSSTQDSLSQSNMVDWIALALSPTAGKEAWLAMMERTAAQLARGGQTVLAATCYLACSKVYDAIDVYRKARMYREAIAVAKLRLPAVDRLIPALFAEWGDLLKNVTTEEEFAAMCFIQGQLPGSTIQAINLLARKQKDGHLFWSACLACLLNDSTAEQRITQYTQAIEKRAAKGTGETPK